MSGSRGALVSVFPSSPPLDYSPILSCDRKFFKTQQRLPLLQEALLGPSVLFANSFVSMSTWFPPLSQYLVHTAGLTGYPFVSLTG